MEEDAEDRHGGAAREQRHGRAEPAGLLCILSVFVPAFIMEDPLRSLFMPLTLAVGFAMISSYLLSITFVPIMSVYLLKHKEDSGAGRKEARSVRPDHPGLSQGRGMVRRTPLVGGHHLSRRLRPDPGVAGVRGRHRIVPADRFRGIRAPVPAAARVELRADPRGGSEVSPGDRARGRHQERRDHDGLRGSGRPQLRHRQHGAVHARAGRRLAARQIQRG